MVVLVFGLKQCWILTIQRHISRIPRTNRSTCGQSMHDLELSHNGTERVTKGLARLMSVLRCTSGHRQFCHFGTKPVNASKFFQDAILAGDMADSRSTSGGKLCTFGDHTFVRMSWHARNRSQCRTAAQKLR